ncbi:hypothetical protein PoB_006554000 [Plakobranchus ocellatus]|uniref:Uncharacterized protein n=1 Tax=Plakobranchus ocellatus TaxID=259542 RepID=A0AAV4D4L7_9GAST|nr:hypothetical protein PoB_006554000 [Plakobranchus ocellatus]
MKKIKSFVNGGALMQKVRLLKHIGINGKERPGNCYRNSVNRISGDGSKKDLAAKGTYGAGTKGVEARKFLAITQDSRGRLKAAFDGCHNVRLSVRLFHFHEYGINIALEIRNRTANFSLPAQNCFIQ